MSKAAYKFISKAYIINTGNIICSAESFKMFKSSNEGLTNVSMYLIIASSGCSIIHSFKDPYNSLKMLTT